MSIEILPSAPGVIAIRLQGKLAHEEVLRLIDLLESSVATNEKTHVFAEAIDISGLDVRHIPEYLRRGGPMLGKLKRFGRIAVVSDQRWLRTVARIESAILPNISYEIFDPDERERALAWVEGREENPRPAGIRIVETDEPDVLAFEIHGKLERNDLEAVAAQFLARPAERVIGKIIHSDGAAIRGLVDDDFVKMKLAGLSGVKRYALVGGPAWLAGWVSVVDMLARADVRHFPLEKEAAAWQWIDAQPRQSHSNPG